MLILLYGGAASGKSEFAEDLVVRLGARRLYIATMRPAGPQALRRIARHRLMRAEKSFDTAEVYTHADMPKLEPNPGSSPGYDVALLECVTNLLANEMFADMSGVIAPAAGRRGIADAPGHVLRTVERAAALFENVVIVTGDVFTGADGYAYENPDNNSDNNSEVYEYMRYLGRVNAAIAKTAGAVIEIVCGLPVVHKSL